MIIITSDCDRTNNDKATTHHSNDNSNDNTTIRYGLYNIRVGYLVPQMVCSCCV